jgi:hypothetical protein
MHTYEAYVRVPNNFVVKTRINADTEQQAYFLLQGQYGSENVVHLPVKI